MHFKTRKQALERLLVSVVTRIPTKKISIPALKKENILNAGGAI